MVDTGARIKIDTARIDSEIQRLSMPILLAVIGKECKVKILFAGNASEPFTTDHRAEAAVLMKGN